MKQPLSFLKCTFEQIRKNARIYYEHSSVRFINSDGNVIFYILIAIALLGMLTFAFVQDSGDNVSKQNSYKISEELYSQFNSINSAVMSCIIEFPAGGGDLDTNGKIEAADNDNRPYPLSPSDANNPGGAAANDQVRNMKCPGSGLGIYKGAGAIGKYLAAPPSGFAEWELLNDTNGVRIRSIGENSATVSSAITALQKKFDTCRTDLNYGACGTNCISIWIKKAAGC